MRQIARFNYPKYRFRRCFLFILSPIVILCIGGCPAGRPYLWDHNTFQSGRVLDKDNTEIELHTILEIPLFGSVAHGFADGWEARINVGQVGGVVGEAAALGAELGLCRALLRKGPFRSSITLGLEGFTTPFQDQDFTGGRVTVSHSMALYPKPWFGIFVPTKVSWLNSMWREELSRGFVFIYGIGFGTDLNQFFVRGAYNNPLAIDYPFTYIVGDVSFFQFLGLQIGYRW